jgi:uncharacterized protein
MNNEATYERPDEKVLLVWRLSNLLGYAIFTGIVLLVLSGVAFATKNWNYLFLILFPITLWAASARVLRKQWENWLFKVDRESLEMCHGWIWKNRRVVARDRIQHIDINSGPFDRRFGLVQVVVHTAGTSVGMIPGLRPERAQELRDELLAGRGA